MKYRCLGCGYSFAPKTDRPPRSCPNCSSPNIRKAETAQDFINSSNKRQIPD